MADFNVTPIQNVENDCTAAVVDSLAMRCHFANERWWHDIHTGKRLDRNKGELLALIHSEISETLEGVRKNQQDKHLPQFKAEEVELADALIRIFDYAGGFNLKLGEAFVAKMAYNAQRADHTNEARRAADGKKF